MSNKHFFSQCCEPHCHTVYGCKKEVNGKWEERKCNTCIKNDCPTDNKDVSHGLCEPCFLKAMRRVRRE